MKARTPQRPQGKAGNTGHASEWGGIHVTQASNLFHGIQPSRIGGGGINRCGSCFQIT